jgi:serine/threonine-protein kinase
LRPVFETSTMTQENMLARYRILHELGRGAIGAVYAARDRETGAVVALKRLDPGLASKLDANFAERLLKQVRSARLLKHRNIVKIHDAGEVGGTVYVAMEMLEGESLRKILDDGPLPIARAIRITHDIACGLAHAHLEGVVHGGVKPSNVVVLRSGAVKITDFGFAQLGYMSPEQARGDPLDHRCDMFALGALLYEMLAHRPPFEGDSQKKIMENILHAEPPPPSELNPHIPRALDELVLSMLARHPERRLAGAPVLMRDLQRIEEGLGLGSGASAGAEEPVPPARPEPRPRMPDASRLRDRAPLPSAAEELEHGNRSADREVFDYEKAMLMMDRESRPERSSGSRLAIFAGALAVVLALVGIGVIGFMYYAPGRIERGIAAIRMQEAPAIAPMASRPAAPPPVAEAITEPASAPAAPEEASPPPAVDGQAEQALAAEPGPSAQSESPVARAPEQPASAGAARAEEPQRETKPTANVPEQQSGGTARLILAVSPRGEIYIDGKHHGTTPPITTLDLEPGMHRIEVRSGSRTPYLTYMTVQAGDVRRIRHDFNPSRAVYPPKSASWQSSNPPAR